MQRSDIPARRCNTRPEMWRKKNDCMHNDPKLQWAPKVRQDKIRRLYELDARGIVDEELIEDVGIALYSRCRSILLVSSQRIECPRCATVFHAEQHDENSMIVCPTQCGWNITGTQYHHSWRHHDLIGTNTPAFQDFVDRYPRALSPQQKMVLIDQLIHAFHQSIRYPVPHRAAANNLIEGNHQQVVAFLDTLTYGNGNTPGMQETQAAWKETMQEMQKLRRSKL